MADDLPEAMGDDDNMDDADDAADPGDRAEGPRPPTEEDEEEAGEAGDEEGQDDMMNTALGAEEDESKEEPPIGGGGPEGDNESEGEEEECDGEEDASRDQSGREQYDATTSFAEGRGLSADTPAAEAQQDFQHDQGEQNAKRPEDTDPAPKVANRSSATASGDNGDGTEYMDSNATPPAGVPPTPPRRQPQPNPYRSLGDALEFWHRKLQLVQREMEAEENEAAAKEENELPAPSTEQQQAAAPAPDEKREFELTMKDEASDAQVMADATQEQYDAMMHAEHNDKQAPDADEGEDPSSGGAEAAGADMENSEEMPPPTESEKPSSPQREPPKRSGAEELIQSSAKRRKGIQENVDRSQDELAAGDGDAEQEANDIAREVLDGQGVGHAREDDTKAGGGSHVGREDKHQQLEREPDPCGTGANGNDIEDDHEDDEDDPEEAEAMVAALEEDLEARLAEWQLNGSSGGARIAEDAWRALETRTSSLAQELTEQLRLILEATVASKLQGDYRTGKRISMRKVIPYIASGFRKDKIWLRRTKPSKRQYQILLCIDDSESMRATGAGMLACESLALICQALTTLEAGQLGVVSFAEEVKLLHPFGRPFTADVGAHMLSSFTFRQQNTRMETLLKSIVTTLRVAREQQSAGASAEQLQLVLIVSDGRRGATWGDPKQWIRQAAQENILLCFVVLDSSAEKDSILELKSISYPNGKLTMSRYIDEFPFPYYLVVRELKALPQVLSDALRQWFEMLEG